MMDIYYLYLTCEPTLFNNVMTSVNIKLITAQTKSIFADQ